MGCRFGPTRPSVPVACPPTAVEPLDRVRVVHRDGLPALPGGRHFPSVEHQGTSWVGSVERSGRDPRVPGEHHAMEHSPAAKVDDRRRRPWEDLRSARAAYRFVGPPDWPPGPVRPTLRIALAGHRIRSGWGRLVGDRDRQICSAHPTAWAADQSVGRRNQPVEPGEPTRRIVPAERPFGIGSGWRVAACSRTGTGDDRHGERRIQRIGPSAPTLQSVAAAHRIENDWDHPPGEGQPSSSPEVRRAGHPDRGASATTRSTVPIERMSENGWAHPRT